MKINVNQKIKLNKNEIQIIVQTINIPLGAYGYDEFIESTKIDELEIVRLMEKLKDANDTFEIMNENIANMLIKALVKANEIAGTEYYTLTGFEDSELHELVSKLFSYKD